MLVVTPMVLFCGASLNGSAHGDRRRGRVLRLPAAGRPSRCAATRWWVLTALSGAVLALSRSVSPLWLVLALLVALAWSGARPFARAGAGSGVAAQPRRSCSAAVAVNRVWEALYGSHTLVDLSELHAGLVAGAHEWWTALPELVGKFGYLDVKLPLVVPVVWLGLVGALLAARRGAVRRRERVLLAVVLVAALARSGGLLRGAACGPIGFGLQGRHVLPILVAVPLLAGETLYRRRERARRQRWLARFAVAIPARGRA